MKLNFRVVKLGDWLAANFLELDDENDPATFNYTAEPHGGVCSFTMNVPPECLQVCKMLIKLGYAGTEILQNACCTPWVESHWGDQWWQNTRFACAIHVMMQQKVCSIYPKRERVQGKDILHICPLSMGTPPSPLFEAFHQHDLLKIEFFKLLETIVLESWRAKTKEETTE